MIRVIPYIETLGSKKFKEFLQQEFNFDMIDNVQYSNVPIIFEGWKGEEDDRVVYFKCDNTYLRFYPHHYEILTSWKEEYSFPHPKSVNDFINDMCRIGIELYWSKWIDENFEPKEYMSEGGVEEYFRDLLAKMDKSHELSEDL